MYHIPGCPELSTGEIDKILIDEIIETLTFTADINLPQITPVTLPPLLSKSANNTKHSKIILLKEKVSKTVPC